MSNLQFIHPDDLQNWIEIPIDYLSMFLGDPERFLRDTANIPTEAITPFFRNKIILQKAQKMELKNPFNDETFRLEDWWEVRDRFYRYIHIDLSKNRDRAGIACCYAPYFVKKQRTTPEGKVFMIDVPFVVYDFIGAVQPKGKWDEIDPMQFVELIEDVSGRGVPIRLVTFDSYQSQAPISALRDMGYVAGVLSIDRTSYGLIVDGGKPPFYLRKQTTDGDISAAMNSLKQALIEERLQMPYHPLWLEEGESLEWIADKGKVIKSINSSDDLVQPVAGALFNLEMNEGVFVEISQPAMTDKDRQIKKQEDELINLAQDLHKDIEDFYHQERGKRKDEYNQY